MKVKYYTILFWFLLLPYLSFAGNPLVKNIYTADPAAMVASNGVFYIYCGHDEAPEGGSGFNMWNWHILSSTDMVNWTDHGAVLSVGDLSWANANAWAGHCVEKNGKFYWYVPAQNKNGDNGWMGIGVVTSNSPTGPFTDARGSALITSKTPTADDMLNIDPAVFTDDDGSSYLYWGSWGKLRMARLQNNMIELAETPRVVDAPRFFEAAWVHKRNGMYYLSYAAGSNPATIEYCTSNSPYGPWTYRGVVNDRVYNSPTNHHSIVEYKGQSYFVYHNGLAPGGGEFRRSVCIDYLKYNTDGTMQRVIQTVEGVGSVGGCNPTAITPYIQINAGAINQTASADVSAGSSVKFSPQPTSGGSWSWSGPSGFSAAIREVTLSNVQSANAGTYIATYTNSCGTKTTQNFTLLVNGSSGVANIGLSATASTSFVSSWETLSAVNNNSSPANSNDKSTGAYGNWNNPNSTQWVQYDWLQTYSISSVEIYWFDDGGGVLTPTTAYLDYWNGSAWIRINDVPKIKDSWNTLNLSGVNASRLRLSMLNTTQSTGILEWRVWGKPQSNTATNIAPVATASTSYVSSWETLSAVNNNSNPANSNDKSMGAYGNWNNPNSTQWVQYDWSQAYFISSVEIYWFDDGGGVLTPTTAYLDYWNGSAWIRIGDVPKVKDAWNTLNVPVVSTSRLRLSMLNTTQSTGILEWRVKGSVSTSSRTVSATKSIETTAEASHSIVVYPNPVQSNFAIYVKGFDSDEKLTLKMIDLTGKAVYSKNLGLLRKVHFNREELPLNRSIYLLLIQGQQRSTSGKIVFKD